MTGANGGARRLITLFVVFGAVIAGVEAVANRQPIDGSFLLVLTVWTMLVQGCVALAAVGEVAKGLWLIPIKRDLLSFYPLLFFTAILYLVIALRMEIYGWTEHPTAWLNVQFFLARNVVVLLLTAWVGRLLARAVMAHSPRKNTYAVYYLFLFVTSQSLVAFDWIMSLEYPFVSTLFGGYFFIQSFLMGLLMSSYIIFFRTRKGETGLTKRTLRDAGTMTFGFCFLWGGFFFAQYLVIWYGNIPEEVDYVLKRVGPSPFWGLSRAVLLMVFVFPFVTLLFGHIKNSPRAMAAIASMIFAGLFLEKVVLVTPVVSAQPVFIAVEAALLVGLLIMVYRMRDTFMPQLVTGEVARKSPHPPLGEQASHR